MEKISIDIDCTKISKLRLKNGKYLKAVLIPSPNSKYGSDYMITEATTTEEYKAGTKGAIIGNARIFALKASDVKNAQPTPRQLPQDQLNDDDVPF